MRFATRKPVLKLKRPLHRYVVTVAGCGVSFETHVRAESAVEARRIAYGRWLLHPIRVEPDMTYLARKERFFIDELMAAVWGLRA